MLPITARTVAAPRPAYPHLPARIPHRPGHFLRNVVRAAQGVHGWPASRQTYTTHTRSGQGFFEGAEHGKVRQHNGFKIVETRLSQTLDIARFEMASKNSSRVGVVCQRRIKLPVGPGGGYRHRRFDEHQRQHRRGAKGFKLVAPSAPDGRHVRQQKKTVRRHRWRRRAGPVRPRPFAGSRRR